MTSYGTLPADLQSFSKSLTRGHHVIMGRKTFESLGKPLPKRTNIVVSRNPRIQGGRLHHWSIRFRTKPLKLPVRIPTLSFWEVPKFTNRRFQLPTSWTSPYVHEDFEADAFFPEFDPAEWEINRKRGLSKRTMRTLTTTVLFNTKKESELEKIRTHFQITGQ